MTHSIMDLKRYQRGLGYGDFKAIKERLQEKGITVSKTAITQVIQGVYCNENILDEARLILEERNQKTVVEQVVEK